eukprot:TRINITY_DN13845_c0_g3_i6.p1 TRINITY_DN13845_c0_g3~~TRINITY_DN13845_c0_g3_i6.p1  ORF type:complete len:769 (-),score=128.18 TRINITY_DN13845_c0_g3_i6:393-2699(-)
MARPAMQCWGRDGLICHPVVTPLAPTSLSPLSSTVDATLPPIGGHKCKVLAFAKGMICAADPANDWSFARPVMGMARRALCDAGVHHANASPSPLVMTAPSPMQEVDNVGRGSSSWFDWPPPAQSGTSRWSYFCSVSTAIALSATICSSTRAGLRRFRQRRSQRSSKACALELAPALDRPGKRSARAKASSHRGGAAVLPLPGRRSTSPSLHIRFFYASPICEQAGKERLPKLDAESEYTAMAHAMQHAAEPDVAKLTASVATADSLSLAATAKDEGEEWWHISAHCDPETGRLVLEDEDGCAHLLDVRPSLVAERRFGGSGRRPPLGVLVLSCASERIGRMMLECGVTFVVVTLGPLLDAAARMFTTYFYRVLLAAWPLRNARRLARTGQPRALLPQLHDLPAAGLSHDVSDFSDIAHGDAQKEAVMAAFSAAREALRSSTRKDLRAAAERVVILEPSGPARQLSLTDGASNDDIESAIVLHEEDNVQRAASFRQDVECWEDEEEAASDCYSAEGLPRSLSGERPSWHKGGEMSAAWPSEGRPCLPEDCEDFVGRPQELLALSRLVGSRGRRLGVLHGAAGVGKSALVAEFCRFIVAPGRRFAEVPEPGKGTASAGQQRLAYVSLRNLAAGRQMASDKDAGQELEDLVRSAVAGAASALSGSAAARQTCLVVDSADTASGWHDDIATSLLGADRNLSLLLVRRQPLYRLDAADGDRWKPVNMELGSLTARDAATLFMRRVHRPLREGDFVEGSRRQEILKSADVVPR